MGCTLSIGQITTRGDLGEKFRESNTSCGSMETVESFRSSEPEILISKRDTSMVDSKLNIALPALPIHDVLKYRHMRSAFIAFMIEQMDEHDISYLQGSQSLLLTDTESHVISAKSIALEYLKYSSSSDDVTLKHIEANCEESAMFKIFQSLEAIQVDMIAIITIRSFYHFLMSGSWKNDYRSPINSPPGSSRIDWVEQQPICYFDNSMNLDSKIKSVYDLFVLDDYLVSRSLLTTLMMALKYIPVAISVASIDKTKKMNTQFPLVYVNDMFAAETDYDKITIINSKSNYFLHNSKAEPKVMAEVQRSLEYGKAIKFEIKSYKQNGITYRNFVALKPVFDQNMNQRYMFSCMYNIDNEDSSLAKIKLVDQVLTMIPDIVILEACEMTDSSFVPLSMI